MAFGKRTEVANTGARPAPRPAPPSTQPSASPSAPAVPLTNPAFAARLGLLIADLTRVRGEATAIAKLIRSGARLDTAAFHGAIAPETFPINVAGFSRHFNFQRDGKLKHGVYCYVLPGDVLDRKAQLHLLEMATAIHSFNTMCIASHEENALPIALQSPGARDSVDKVIVMSAHFCGTLHNLVYQQAVLSGSPEQKKKGPDAAKMKQTIAEWSVKAKQAMLAKDRFDFHYPDVAGPVFIAETETADHQGQLVVNQVYLPVELAQPVMAKMAAAQARR